MICSACSVRASPTSCLFRAHSERGPVADEPRHVPDPGIAACSTGCSCSVSRFGRIDIVGLALILAGVVLAGRSGSERRRDRYSGHREPVD